MIENVIVVDCPCGLSHRIEVDEHGCLEAHGLEVTCDGCGAINNTAGVEDACEESCWHCGEPLTVGWRGLGG